MTTAPITSESKYQAVAGWAKIPHGIWLREAPSVAVDDQDRVYVFNRGNVPMLTFDSDGNLISQWGNDTPYSGMTTITDPYGISRKVWDGVDYVWPHSVRADHEDNLWLVDVHTHTITKTTKQGDVLLRIGTGDAAIEQSGDPFNKPTDVAVSPKTGEVIISDGYGNSRIHRYDKDGNHILSWGEPGADDAQFSLPHNLALLGDDKVVVCDRENHRVQLFTIEGEFIRNWHAHKAVAVTVGANNEILVAEQGPPPVQFGVPNLGHRVSIFNETGELINRLGRELPGESPDQFLWPHSIATDSQGSIYVAEVSYVEVGSKQDPAREMVSLRKWERIS